MKATGIVRKVDELGRIVIPKELRKIMNIEEGTAMAIYTDGEQIILKKYEPGCLFCGQVDNIINFRGRLVCPECAKEIGSDAESKPVEGGN